MSTVTKPIFTDETGRAILRELQKGNALREATSAGAVQELYENIGDIHNIVRSGYADKIFHIGDQIVIPWKDVAADVTYRVPHDIVHFGNVTLRDGSVVPGMFLQWHYCSPFGVQFDHQEAEVATESNFLSTYYYYEAYTSGGDTRYKLLVEGTDYNNEDPIPSGSALYHSAIKDTTGYIVNYGYNRWSHSGIRQFLNSKKGVNQWWEAKHLGDVAPNELTTKAGFMSGYDDDFLACVKPVKVTTALNTVTDSAIGTTEDTYDTFFLPSLQQMYGTPQLSGVEGEYFEYWKQALGRTSPAAQYTTYPEYIAYAINAQSSAQPVRLRSADRGSSYSTWYVYSTGYLGSYTASNSNRFAPVCVIC